MNGLVLFSALAAGCGQILGEDFSGYQKPACAGGSQPACAGSVGASGSPSGIAGGGTPSGGGNANSTASAGDVNDARTGDAGMGGATPVGNEPAAAGDAGSAGEAGAGGMGGGSIVNYPDCQPGAPVVPECHSNKGYEFPPVGMPAVQGVGMLSTEQYAGGFSVFGSKRTSPTVAQLWNKTATDTEWMSWSCFDSLPQPDRFAAHALHDGAQEVFATTRCGDLYRRVEQIDSQGAVWLAWQAFSLPPAGSIVTDVALSKAADNANVVFVADGGQVFARPRLGSEQASSYAGWFEVTRIWNAQFLTAGMRADQRQQLFVVDTNGSVRTAIQSDTNLGSRFGAWSDFDSSQLAQPVLDVEAPLGGSFPLEVFAVDANGTLWQRRQDEITGEFEAWRPWDGPALPAKVTALTGAGLRYTRNAVRLAVLTEAGAVYTSKREFNLWDAWRLFP